MSEIENAMLSEIQLQHDKATTAIERARVAIREACEQAIVVSTLVDKSAAHKRMGLVPWIAENTDLTRNEVKAYKSAHVINIKRDLANDKRGLQVLGILDKARPQTTVKTSVAPSAAQEVNRISARVNKKLSKRPINVMSSVEKLQLKQSIKPLAEIFVELSQPQLRS